MCKDHEIERIFGISEAGVTGPERRGVRWRVEGVDELGGYK